MSAGNAVLCKSRVNELTAQVWLVVGNIEIQTLENISEGSSHNLE
jgi:hypothetical protein